jgi:hypothetical protein
MIIPKRPPDRSGKIKQASNYVICIPSQPQTMKKQNKIEKAPGQREITPEFQSAAN